MVFRDVTDKKLKQDEILYLCYHDSLAKLYNRRYIEEKIKQIEETSRILMESCRPTDIVARWGGDEFLILLPNTDASTAEMICENINKKCAELTDINIKLSISLGYAVRKNDNKEIQKEAMQELINNAGKQFDPDLIQLVIKENIFGDAQ